MNRTTEKVANIITSLGAVIFVLLMTIIAMIFLGHGLYYQIFIRTMVPWQAEVASWVLSFGIETTVLIVTSNVKFFNRWLPVFLAVCSGLIVLFFIEAFDASQPTLTLCMRWFIGVLVAGINLTYSELFFQKHQEHIRQLDMEKKYHEIKTKYDLLSDELANRTHELGEAKIEMGKLNTSILDLESFKERELIKLRCEFCNRQFESIYKRASHQGICEKNPKKGVTPSVFEAIV